MAYQEPDYTEILANVKEDWEEAKAAGNKSRMKAMEARAEALRGMGADETQANIMVYGEEEGEERTQLHSPHYVQDDYDLQLPDAEPQEQTTTTQQTATDPYQPIEHPEEWTPDTIASTIRDPQMTSEARSIMGQVQDYLERAPYTAEEIMQTDQYQALEDAAFAHHEPRMDAARADLAARGVLAEGSTPAVERMAQEEGRLGRQLGELVPQLVSTEEQRRRGELEDLMTALGGLLQAEGHATSRDLQAIQQALGYEDTLWGRDLEEQQMQADIEAQQRQDALAVRESDREYEQWMSDQMKDELKILGYTYDPHNDRYIYSRLFQSVLNDAGLMYTPETGLIQTREGRSDESTTWALSQVMPDLLSGEVEGAFATVAHNVEDWAEADVDFESLSEFLLTWLERYGDEWDQDLVFDMIEEMNAIERFLEDDEFGPDHPYFARPGERDWDLPIE